MLKTLTLFVGLTALCLIGCSDEGEDDTPLNWECFSDAPGETCRCYGLGPNEALNIGDTSAVPIDVCPDSPVCVTFHDEEGGTNCSCGPEGFTPSEEDTPTEIESIAACPPVTADETD